MVVYIHLPAFSVDNGSSLLSSAVRVTNPWPSRTEYKYPAIYIPALCSVIKTNRMEKQDALALNIGTNDGKNKA